ncbi:type I phosphomannose isomerase catalytic subunit [Mycoplasmopsis agassizii]|uniref:Phosphomannose isomerase type I catalytic domain-containing protein n=1 Tax=Mycoplasmopsis agassizii TaxID=33922 RepID=A0ABX4H518_9BACT|nr:type I phosphomannose isomerase catalytic subunit [Mycoplasmopsis agassizii]PAF54965.1 hypothetical protein CJF60_04495 [Mycoplasmopsis agassizii]SMC16956.1 mannose-6-phosphate isomerase [Mycoplasmopsis agassizii]
MFKYLILKPYLDYKIWGGNHLANWFNSDRKNIGEALVISALENKESVIINLGQEVLLSEFYRANKKFFGNYYGDLYPLLGKIIDANDDLSIQVHPDDEYAEKHFYKLGKTECWYVLEAPKNAQIIYGSKVENIDTFKEHVSQNNWDQILNYETVKKGDLINVPHGTIHAITKGITVFEIQQNSDLTFRLYDYDRLDINNEKRELHLDHSFNVLNLKNKIEIINKEEGILFESEFFNIEKLIVDDEIFIKKENAYWTQITVIKGYLNVDYYSLTKGYSLILKHKIGWKLKGQAEILLTYIEKKPLKK